MRKKTLLVIIILLGIIRVPVFSQTTMGTDFYLSIGKNGVNNALSLTMQVRVVASKATNITGTFAADGSLNFAASLNAGEVRTIDLSDNQKTAVYSDATGSSSKSLRILSTEPVSVYVLNQALGATDATNVLPVNTLGTEYYHLSYAPYHVHEDSYTVVATENGTTVSENDVQKVTLNAGEVYSFYNTLDMTGRRITSSKPVAYFVSNTTRIPNSTVMASDCLFQQLMPVSAWGKNFFVPPTKRGAERVRIIASENNTGITQTGGTVEKGSLTLDKGEFVELEIKLAKGGCYISADKPIGVCSYLSGEKYSELSYSTGDPAFTWVPPVEQFVNLITIAPFVELNRSVLNEHYALIVAATATRDQTTMAIGNSTSFTSLSGGTWTTGIGNPSYSFYSLPLTDQSYTFANTSGLSIMCYGLGLAEAYYYLAGSAARDLTAAFYVNGEHYFDVNGKKYCGVLNFRLKSVLEYASNKSGFLEWYIDGVRRDAATDQPEWDLSGLQPGTHTIRMYVRDQNNLFHSFQTAISICLLRIPVNPSKTRLNLG